MHIFNMPVKYIPSMMNDGLQLKCHNQFGPMVVCHKNVVIHVLLIVFFIKKNSNRCRSDGGLLVASCKMRNRYLFIVACPKKVLFMFGQRNAYHWELLFQYPPPNTLMSV